MTRSADWTTGLVRSLALAIATVLALGFSAAVPAQADPAPQLSLAMTALTATGSGADDTVTMNLTLTNTGTVAAYGVLAKIWRSRDPLRDKATLLAATTASTSGGWPNLPGNYQLITNSKTAFAPGATRQFTLTATMAQLGFDTLGGAYALGVDVVATTDQSSNNTTVAKIRTFIPMATTTAVPVTAVALLSAPPTKVATNLFANENLTAELSGRLNALLTAASEPSTSWLIDPALLDEVRDQADGYQVSSGTTIIAGTGQQAAADWLARFDRLDRSRGGRTLFANPDTFGAAAAKSTSLPQWSATASASVPGIAELPLVIVPTGNTVNDTTLKALATSGAAGVVAGNTQMASALQTAAGLRILGAASMGWESAQTDSTAAITQRQLALAETVIAGQAGQLRLLRTSADLTQNAATQPSWVAKRTLGDLLRTPATSTASFTDAKPDYLNKAHFSGVNRLVSDVTAYRALVPDSQLAALPEAAYSRALASAWASDTAGGNAYLRQLELLFGQTAVAGKVSLHAISYFTMSARSNQFPITITNNLTESVRVRVVVNTNNPQRLSVPQTELVTVGPGQSQTVNIHPVATANGLIPATTHLATEDGRQVGGDVALTFEVTDLGVVGWIIVIVSGVVLIAATAWRIRQVRRRTPKEDPPDVDDQPDDDRPAEPKSLETDHVPLSQQIKDGEG